MAVNLLWVGTALGLARLLLDPAALIDSTKAMVVAGAFVVAVALYAFLIVKISAGRNRARITLLILVPADLVLSGPGIVSGFGRAPLGALRKSQITLSLRAATHHVLAIEMATGDSAS